MKCLKIIFPLLVLMLLSACGSDPIEITLEQACTVENDDTKVMLIGAFSSPSMMSCDNYSGSNRCGLNLNSAPDADDGFSADIRTGNGKNQMQEVESGFTDDDIQIKTDEGGKIGIGDEVWVTGEMHVSNDTVSGDLVCYMYVSKVEVAE